MLFISPYCDLLIYECKTTLLCLVSVNVYQPAKHSGVTQNYSVMEIVALEVLFNNQSKVQIQNWWIYQSRIGTMNLTEMDWSGTAWAVQMKVKHNQCGICAVPYQRTLNSDWPLTPPAGEIKHCQVDHEGQDNFAFIFRCNCPPDWIPALEPLRMHPTSRCLFTGKKGMFEEIKAHSHGLFWSLRGWLCRGLLTLGLQQEHAC